MGDPVDFKQKLYDIYKGTPRANRGEWVMSEETADAIAKAEGHMFRPDRLFGLPVRFDSAAEDIRLAEVSKPALIRAEAFHDALVASGVVREGERIRRIVIDAEADSAVLIHVERYGDKRLLDVVRTLDGINVQWVSING